MHLSRTSMLAIAWLACSALAHADEAPTDLVFHADLQGRFAAPACSPGQSSPPDFAALVSTIEQLRSDAVARNAPAPIALLGGNVIGPDLFARGVLKRDADLGALLLGELLARVGYAAIALGPHDLSIERDRLQRFTEAAAKLELPLVATNLRCDTNRQTFCSHVRRDRLIEQGAQRIGIMATISPLAAAGIPRASLEGLGFEPLEASVRAAARALRERGATRVVLLHQAPRSRAGREELSHLQRATRAWRPDAGVDLILAGGLSHPDSASVLRLWQEDGAAPVVGSGEGTDSVSAVRWTTAADDRSPRVEVLPVNAAGKERDERAAELLAPHLETYCQRYGEPIGPGATDGLITRDAFLGYVLAVMRKAAGAEVALINRGFVRPQVFPLAGRVTRAALFRALPYPAALGTARLTGADLVAKLAPALGAEGLALLGIERGTPLKVNGRPIDPARHYTIATIPFVAEGGDELVPTGVLKWKPLPGDPAVRDVVEAFVATQTAVEDADVDVDPRSDFGRPASERALWVMRSDLSADLSDIRVQGTMMPARTGYDAPQLTRAEQRAIKSELVNVVELRALAHEADLRLRVAYGYARNQPQGKVATSGETADQVSFSSLYNFRGLRDLSLPVPRPAVPDPYVRVLLESELTKPATRAYHFAELTATVGALFTPVPKLRLRGGPGLRKQLFADGPTGETMFLVEAGVTLAPVALPLPGGLPARLEGVLDYVFLNPTRTRQHQLRGNARLALPLLMPLLFLTIGVDVYAAQSEGLGWATALDTIVGLRVHWDAAHQRL